MFYWPHPPLDWHSPGLNERMFETDGGLGRFNFFFFDSLHIEIKKHPKKFTIVHHSHAQPSTQERWDLIFPIETYIYKLYHYL